MEHLGILSGSTAGHRYRGVWGLSGDQLRAITAAVVVQQLPSRKRFRLCVTLWNLDPAPVDPWAAMPNMHALIARRLGQPHF